MPYKPTGRPNGRPRKVMAEAPERAEPQPVATTRPVARKRFRMVAEMQNPSPFVTVFDGRGRPRHKPRHSSVKV